MLERFADPYLNPCARLPMYKVLLLRSRPNRSFVAPAGLRPSSTQRTSRIIDPGVDIYFFSQAGHQDCHCEEICRCVSRSMCPPAYVQSAKGLGAENGAHFSCFSLYRLPKSSIGQFLCFFFKLCSKTSIYFLVDSSKVSKNLRSAISK